MVDFIVAGVKIYSQNVLQAGTLWFKSNSKLVLAPDENKQHIPTSLTIIADKIRIDDSAEITYNLDGLPGFDPDTPAPPLSVTVGNGLDGGSSPGEGIFPSAKNGGEGGQGQSGKNGISGVHAPELEIFVGQVDQSNLNALTINFKGQDGGKGGNGGNGGNGQKGAGATSSDSWYDGDECTREPGRGGNGGKGGSAGYPGRGGAGGNGGIIKVFIKSPSSVEGWSYIFNGGNGAPAGDPGKEGNGGTGGAQGDKDGDGACPERSEYHGTAGPPGQSIDEIDPDWRKNFKGKDGIEGEREIIAITGVPS